MIFLKKIAGKRSITLIKVSSNKPSTLGTSITTRLLANSLRNLSVSSSQNPSTPLNPFSAGINDENAFKFQPFIARQSNGLARDVGINCPLWRKKEIFEIPLTNKIIESPTKITKIIEEINNVDKIVDLPTHTGNGDDDAGKQAKNGMIMIRRRKMRKHKLRKLRKKMKYEWAKVSLLIVFVICLRFSCLRISGSSKTRMA